MAAGGTNIPRQTLVALITIVVVFVWAIVALSSLLIKDYTTLTIISPVALLVFGAAVTIKKNGEKNA